MIPDSLVEVTVRAALGEPYRQTAALRTRAFVGWLKDRDCPLDERALLFLAREGILPPIAWDTPPNRPHSERFVPVTLDDGLLVYGDRGERPELERLFKPTPLSEGLDTCWWHPFQLWRAIRLMRSLSVSVSATQPLHGSEAHQQLIAWLYEHHGPLDALLEMTQQEAWEDSYRVTALLLATEPLVVERLTNRIRLSRFGEAIDGLFEWRGGFNHAQLLIETGADLDLIREWHGRLAVEAELGDPLSSWRELIRYASREKRLELEGRALQGEEGYYQAEVLRRYVEVYHDVHDLADEDLVRLGPQVPAYKERFFGSRTTTDGDRSVFRNVVRQYGLDPQPRLRWFVEGETEQGFIERWAGLQLADLDRRGIEVINLVGVGNLESDLVRAFLEVSRREEVFVAITVDEDDSEKRRHALERWRAEGLVAHFELAQPDFEGHNFSGDLLVDAVNRQLTADGLPPLTPAEVSSLDEVNIGALGRLLWETRRTGLAKGKAWGSYLAEALHASSAADSAPVAEQFAYLQRAITSNYRFSQSDRGGSEG